MATAAEVALKIVAHDMASGVLRSISSSLGGLAGSASRSTSLFSKMYQGLQGFGLAAQGVNMAAQMVGGFASSLVSGNIEMENTQARFMAFTKDAKLTTKYLTWLRAEADKTPFAFQEMAQSMATLIPAARMAKQPIEEIMQTAEILAASNPMQGIEGAAYAMREALSGDFTSLAERFDLPRSYINKLKKEGVPNIEIVRRAMKQMGYDMSLVDNMGKTFEGRLSTLKDTLTGIKDRAVKPLMDKMKEWLMKAQDWFNENKDTVDGWVSSIRDGLTWFLNLVEQGFKLAWPLLQKVAVGLRDFVKGIADLVAKSGAVEKVGRFIENFATALSELLGGDESRGLMTLYLAFSNLFGPELAGKLEGFVKGLIDLGKYVKDVADTGFIWAGSLYNLPEPLRKVADVLGPLVATVHDFVVNAKDLVGGKIDLGTFFSKMGASLSAHGGEILAALKRIWPTPAQWGEIWKSVRDTAAGAFKFALNVGGKVLEGLKSIWPTQEQWATIWADVQQVARDAWTVGAGVITDIWGFLFGKESLENDQPQFVQGLIPKLLGELDKMMGSLAASIETDPGIRQGAQNAGYAVMNAILDFFAPKKGTAVKSGFQELIEAGGMLAQALFEGMLTRLAGADLRDGLSTAVNALLAGAFMHSSLASNNPLYGVDMNFRQQMASLLFGEKAAQIARDNIDGLTEKSTKALADDYAAKLLARQPQLNQATTGAYDKAGAAATAQARTEGTEAGNAYADNTVAAVRANSSEIYASGMSSADLLRKGGWQKAYSGGYQTGYVYDKQVVAGVTQNTAPPKNAAANLGGALGTAARNPAYKGGYNAGTQLDKGIAAGIHDSEWLVIARAHAVAKAAEQKMLRDLRIQSPSKVFARIGTRMMEGLALGIGKGGEPLAALGRVSRSLVGGVGFPRAIVSQLPGPTPQPVSSQNITFNQNNYGPAPSVIHSLATLRAWASI